MNKTSFRDPSGFVFKLDGEIYRQINKIYQQEYETLMNSGLYDELTSRGLLVPHRETQIEKETDKNIYKFIQPEKIDFISYPYEWCFSELKDAALLTLEIQKYALKFNMCIKDASAYNIQFKNGKPVFIDTLSFEIYKENKPWQAYSQFCRHFLAPLALMSYTDINLNKLLITNIDGIPLELCKKLLPVRAKLNLGILLHIICHETSQKKYKNDTNIKTVLQNKKFSKLAMEGLIDSLENCIKNLEFPFPKTEWSDYYNDTNYSDFAFKEKKCIIREFLAKIKPQTLCDLGANLGYFTRLMQGGKGLAFDIDMNAVEKNYRIVKEKDENYILPLVVDLTNPTPSIGFANEERSSFSERFKCDTVMALALIHHLSISNNLPFENTAEFFSKIGKHLIIEFVPKSDSKVQMLLSSREDIFTDYDFEHFELAYKKFFDILEKVPIKSSERILYLMRRK